MANEQQNQPKQLEANAQLTIQNLIEEVARLNYENAQYKAIIQEQEQQGQKQQPTQQPNK